MRPFAITGTLGLGIPTRVRNESIAVDPVTGQKTVSVDHNPDTLQWGLVLEYSLICLQQHVKEVGLKTPLDHLIPLVEFSMSTPLNRGVNELTTGTINPGVIWSGQYLQVGIEAMIPVNGHTGWRAVSVDTHVTAGNFTFELL